MSAEPFPLCGPSYETLSPAEGIERSLNYYFEASEVPYKPKGPATLYPRPGSKAFGAIPPTIAGSVRAMTQFDGNGVPDGAVFGVSGNTFWQMNPDGSQTTLGTVIDDGLPAYIAVNAAAVGQVFVASGGHGYCLNSGVFAEIPIGANFFGARDVCFIDGYFLVLSATVNNQQFQISALNDGTTWSGADVGLLLGQADPLQRCLVNIEYVYFLGTRRGQIWYNSGNALFPFTIESGAFLEWGTNAAGSACKAGNQQSTTIYWLGQGAQGANVAMRAQGQQTERISDSAVEAAWSNKDPLKFNGQVYTTTDDCISYPFSWKGHAMVRFIFPTAGTGWDYDVTESAAVGFRVWNPVSFTNADGTMQAPFERAHAYAFGKHLIGSGGADGQAGAIYEMDDATYTDASGSPYGVETPTGTTGFSTATTHPGDTTIGPAFLTGSIPTAAFYLSFGGGPSLGGELIRCTAITGPVLGAYSLTVTRGVAGSTAQTWAISTVFSVVSISGFTLTRDRIIRLPWNNGFRVIIDRLEVFGQPGVGVQASNTVFSAVATLGSDTYGVADTTGLTVGQFVTGQSVPVPGPPTIIAIVPNTSVQIDDNALESGTFPLTAISTIPGANPVMLLRISRDGGRSWGAAIEIAMGSVGADTVRWISNRLGYYRDGAIWLRVTDPVFSCLVGAALGIRRLTS